MNNKINPNKFYIDYDNPDQTYFGGQTVSGKVFLYVTTPISTKELALHICGKAIVHWTEYERMKSISTSTEKRGTSYRAAETYLDETIYFCGTPYEEVLLNGYKELNFSFVLPTGIPATFDSKTGKVIYYCAAKIKRNWKSNLYCKAPFIVQCPYDLNLDPNARMAISDEDSMIVSCCFCKNGLISISGNLSRRGYAPGEEIPVSGEIINKSSVTIKKTKAALVLVITTFASGRSHNEEQEIIFIERGRVDAQHTEFWTGIPLEVPDLVPTHLGMSSCQILDLQYYLDFTAETEGLYQSLKVRLPLIVGNMPLNNDIVREVPATPSPNPSECRESKYIVYSDEEKASSDSESDDDDSEP